MLFRDFCEQVKDAAAVHLAGTRGERPAVPMLHVQSRAGSVVATPISGDFFDGDEATRAALALVLPDLMHTFDAEMAAWTLTAWHSHYDNDGELVEEPEEVMVAAVVDRERHEVWRARVLGDQLGPWHSWEPNAAVGLLVTPIQEALR